MIVVICLIALVAASAIELETSGRTGLLQAARIAVDVLVHRHRVPAATNGRWAVSTYEWRRVAGRDESPVINDDGSVIIGCDDSVYEPRPQAVLEIWASASTGQIVVHRTRPRPLDTDSDAA